MNVRGFLVLCASDLVLSLDARGDAPALGASAIFRSAMDRLHVITPYKYHGGWVFDDARVELERELGIEGWLCPALLEYFENAPATLYVGGRGRETGVQP